MTVAAATLMAVAISKLSVDEMISNQQPLGGKRQAMEYGMRASLSVFSFCSNL